jgi:tetratricopeptide (TPR) repeat protein
MPKKYPALFLIVLLGACQASPRGIGNQSDQNRPSYRSPIIAVLPFRTDPDDLELNRFALGLTELSRALLLGFERVQLVDPLGPATPGSDLSNVRNSGAHFALTGELEFDDGQYELTVELVDLNTGSRVESDDIVSPEGALGTMPFEVALSIDAMALDLDARAENDLWITRRELELADRRFKPSIDAFRYFSRGTAREAGNPDQALHYFQRAAEIEPYFREARNGLFRLRHLGFEARQQSFHRITGAALVLMRRNQVDPMIVALTYQELGRRVMPYDRALANRWFQESNRWLYLEGRYRSTYYADNQNAIGSSFLYMNKDAEARTRFQSAHNLIKEMGAPLSLSALESHLNMGNVLAKQKQYGRSLQYYAVAERLVEEGDFGPAIRAVVAYNKGVMYYLQGSFRQAIRESIEARKHLIEGGLENSAMHLSILLNINASLLHTGNYRDAIRISDRIRTLGRAIGETNYPAYRFARHNLAFALERQGRQVEAMRARQRSYGPNRPLYETFLSIHELAKPLELFSTESERQKIASYTGAFNMQYHGQSVRSRTYPGRQDDTNILLRDLLFSNRRDPALLALRRTWLPDGGARSGEGIIFIDVGPGLANVRYPAVTTRSIARDFKSMDVVALDLPEQVQLFRFRVPSYKKRELLAYNNLRIVAADGRDSMRTIFADSSRWLDRERTVPELSDRPVVFRMANSIDIYLNWGENRKVFQQIAEDLTDNPVLIFFNRSILVKPARSKKFKIVGYVSARGFHHNLEILDRGGDPPYTLIDSSDLDYLID